LWINAGFGVIDVRSRLGANGLVAEYIVNGGVNFEDKGREEEMRSSGVAGEITTIGELAVATERVQRFIELGNM
jgi:hypothetical protein